MGKGMTMTPITAQTLAHDEMNARFALDEPAPSQIEHWAQTWANRFRMDASASDGEVHELCEKIRRLLATIEGTTGPSH